VRSLTPWGADEPLIPVHFYLGLLCTYVAPGFNAKVFGYENYLTYDYLSHVQHALLCTKQLQPADEHEKEVTVLAPLCARAAVPAMVAHASNGTQGPW